MRAHVVPQYGFRFFGVLIIEQRLGRVYCGERCARQTIRRKRVVSISRLNRTLYYKPGITNLFKQVITVDILNP